jgi:hypothetical protein
MSRSLAQEAGEALPQIAFRGDRRQIQPAVQDAVNERANNRGTVQRLACLISHDANSAVEFDDLSIEQHDRDFGPFIAVKERSPSAWCPGPFSRRRADALPSHGSGLYRELLVAQTRQCRGHQLSRRLS